jgi:prophage regulatory protein
MKACFVRMPEVLSRTGLSRSHIYKLQSSGLFPKSISLCGGRAVGWLDSEIDEWMEYRINESRGRS